MSRYLITVHNDTDRQRAAKWAMAAKEGMRITYKEAKRTDDQNSKFWAMLSEVAAQVPWHGIKLSTDDWRFIFLDALKRELRTVPNIDGNGFVNLGRSSSDLSKSEMSDLIELIHLFGANHGVVFKDSETEAQRDSALTDQTSPTAPKASAQEPDTSGSGEVHDRCESTSPPNSSATSSRQMKPAATDAPPSEAAGNPSSHPSPGDGSSAGGVETQAPSASALPQGWEILYASALRRAQKQPSLQSLARQFWAQFGGWGKHKDGPDGPAASAIFDAFNNNFGNADAINTALRELI
jgi:hypothetical protein